MRKATIVLAMAICCGPALGRAEELTYVDLIRRLTDLERLAVLPRTGEKCAQWSSYDRRSKYDAETGKYVAWSANGDGGGLIRREGGGIVMAEMEGPGCIWRIWTAAPGDGHVRIYLDGAAEPAVDMPLKQYFNRSVEPFVHPSLVHTTARGKNNYVPIPFARSCKIVADKNWGRYYHFTYSLFPPGTVVPAFRIKLSPAEQAALRAADDFLTNKLGTDPAGRREGQQTINKSVTVEAGKTQTVAELTGPRAITALRVRMSFAGRADEMAALRELVLKITWDGAAAPAVWAPLGDFFGTAPGVNKYRSLPLGMTDEGFYCFWYMPFAKSAKIELLNDGKGPRKADFEVTHAPLTRPIEQLGRFHAKWHRDAFNPVGKDRWPDWTMLITRGRGRYCGVNLHVWNPKGGWWGEGDEKFFVDGEKFPSTIGTGSEDYFGYAWGNPTLFANAYHNQTISQNNRGHVSVNRWHITDNVPFQRSFEGAIEKYYTNERPTLYAAVAYWYLAPGGEDPYPAVPADERWGYCVRSPAFKVKGAVEGEKLKVLSKTGGHAGRQDLFRPAAGGAKMRTCGGGRAPTKELSFGVHELKQGRHKLTVEIVGANEKALKKYMFGLDYVLLKPAK